MKNKLMQIKLLMPQAWTLSAAGARAASSRQRWGATSSRQRWGKMMRKFVCILMIVCIRMQFFNCTAQKSNSWVLFGFPNNNKIEFFPQVSNSAIQNVHNTGYTSNSQISDLSGNLLYYSNGYTIWNAQHQRIMNDDTLAPNSLAQFFYNSGIPAWQMTVFVPDPGDTNEFYLFYGGPDVYYQPPLFGGEYVPDKFYYAKVNKHINGLAGYATSINNIILNDTIGMGVCAIKHGNGRDWWILVRHCFKPEFIRFLVDPNGVHGPYYQTIGPINHVGFVNFKFAPGTNKLGCSNAYHWPTKQFFDIYDFDRCTGLASNPITLNFNDDNFGVYQTNGGCEFSPSGQYFYVSTQMKLRQFDVLAANISASEVILDTVVNPFASYQGRTGRMQMGPDSKIYIDITDGSSNVLSVINNPDSAGFLCNYDDTCITFATPIYTSLPNIPHYEIGPLVGSPCDTLSVNLTPNPSPLGEGKIQCTYISAWEKLFINAQNVKGSHVTVTIYDARGSAIRSYELITKNGHATMDVDCAGWTSGMYIVNLRSDKEVLRSKFVKE